MQIRRFTLSPNAKVVTTYYFLELASGATQCSLESAQVMKSGFMTRSGKSIF
jgi:hypothetical protein